MGPSGGAFTATVGITWSDCGESTCSTREKRQEKHFPSAVAWRQHRADIFADVPLASLTSAFKPVHFASQAHSSKSAVDQNSTTLVLSTVACFGPAKRP